MSAYLIALIRVTDRARYALEYAPRMQATLDAFEGRYLATATPLHVKEGHFGHADEAVLIAFPDLARAEAWYASDAYAPLLDTRREAAITNLAFLAPG